MQSNGTNPLPPQVQRLGRSDLSAARHDGAEYADLQLQNCLVTRLSNARVRTSASTCWNLRLAAAQTADITWNLVVGHRRA